MAYDDYQLIRVAVADGICRATVDHPPINLLDLPLLAAPPDCVSRISC